MRRKGKGMERPHGGPRSRSHAWGGTPPPQRKMQASRDPPEILHLLLLGVYGNFLHHNNGSQLDWGIADDAAWQRRWHRLAAQSASWYATPSSVVGHRFTAILAAEWQGFLGRSWKSKRPLVVITKTLGVSQATEIWARITWFMDLLERGLHAGFVGDAEAEGAAREGMAASGREGKTRLSQGATMTCYFQVSSVRISIGQPIGRGGGVSSQ